ncbi:MarR family transcriptional regulator [Longispora fulva]|uniref:DNA-binding MarR family transcriptional regulator n=1 Tax=Longispora fulva TaxID=619741 RepID=A0A8J7KJW3_9ACTN|nr:MarR family winged helix-turn-helix transcriptional regulator [Longispora fulva]MBG6137314.1 DNA-binding MarR family transcriptional regulator [Longispora fulva]GIG61331.1 MarR family transcriptional regulator [Longispora fulva]
MTNAFLLAQLGAYATGRFAERIGELGLTPPLTGMLRAIAATPAMSQQELAGHLGMPPSRLVAFLDDLEGRGLIERRQNPADRRQSALYATAHGTDTLRAVGDVSRAHDEDITAPLSPAERERLAALLGRIAAHHGLTEGVHPGYRTVRH